MNLGTGACDSPPATSLPCPFGGLVVEVSDASLADWLADFEPALAATLRPAATTAIRPTAVLHSPLPDHASTLRQPDRSGEAPFLGRPSKIAHRGDRTTVDTPARRLRITFDPRRATISGEDPRQVGLSAGVLAATWYAERAREAGWHVVHASCFALNGCGFLCLGAKGSGKSTVALAAATRCGAQLLANDHCLIRVINGAVLARALPQAISVGFGLVAALGWSGALSAAVQRRAMRHPSVRGPRLEAVRHGRGAALLNEEGAEVKMPFLIGELQRLFGVRAIAKTTIDAVLYPRMGAARPCCKSQPVKGLTAADMFPNLVDGTAAIWLRPTKPVSQGFALPLPAFDVALTDSVDAVAETIHRLADVAGEPVAGEAIQ